jgi:hypothetical protein
MHISNNLPAAAPQLSSAGKSEVVAPGLERRGLNLPPGIAKKLETGGTAPAGIATRFPAAAVQGEAPTSDITGTDSGNATQVSDGSQPNTPSVDLLV